MQKIKSSLTDHLRNCTKEMMKELNVPGAAVAIVKDGEIVLSEGFGYRDVEHKKPVTPSTLFAIGSSTKAFGTLSLSLLAQQRKFDWDEPIQTYLPTFSLHDPLVSSQTTARDLASHRSGVSRHELLWYQSSFTRKEIMEKIKHLELDAPFRTSFLYNNLMYVTMSYMVEKITNQTWEQYVSEHILQPLNMENTNFSVTASQENDNHALPYIEKDKDTVKIPLRNIDTVGAAGCINSTIEDMAKWILFHLNQGKAGDHELITPNLLQQMYEPHIPIPDDPLLSTSETTLTCYGLGWFISAYRGYKVIHHGGNIDGFSALISFIPEENIGLVILTNAGTTLLPTYLANQIYDEILELDPIDWHQRSAEDTAKFKEIMKELDKPFPQVKETSPTHELKEYTGIFEHPAYGEIEVDIQNDLLHLKWGSLHTEMKHHHYNMFTVKWDISYSEMNLLIAYEMETEGKLSQLKLNLSPMLSAKPIVFTKLEDRDTAS